MRVLVLGAGKMLEAILIGLKDTQDFSTWGVYSPSGVSAEKLSSEIGAQWVKEIEHFKADYVFIGCKPQQLNDLKHTIGENLKAATFVSVLAAISEEKQLEVLKISKLIRVMPNLPVRFKEGVSLIASHSAPKEAELIQKLFSNIGEALILKEEELEELTLLTGSGPAFFYEFAHNLASSFTSLDQTKREQLARAVMIGSAVSAKKSEEKLEQMVGAVTSKGGVTIAVLENWRESKLCALIKTGISAGKKRSQDLQKLLSQN